MHSTCNEGVATWGRQQGGWKLAGGPGPRRGVWSHHGGRCSPLQPCHHTPHPRAARWREQLTPNASPLASVVRPAFSSCHQTRVSLPGTTALLGPFPFSVLLPLASYSFPPTQNICSVSHVHHEPSQALSPVKPMRDNHTPPLQDAQHLCALKRITCALPTSSVP